MSKLYPAVIATALLVTGAARGESPSMDDIRRAVDNNVDGAVSLYREFLALPNDALHPDDIDALVTWMEGAFGERGFRTQRIPTEGNPSLFAERRHDAAARTVLVYLQADGQPVDPSAWAQSDPFSPVLKRRDGQGDWQQIPWENLDERFDPDWRVFARSASEELGSPHLAAAIRAHRDLLAADLLLIFDGPPHASNRPTVTFGARGIMTATLVAYGPRVAQHSGHYGNFVPNPAFDLARILASLKSPDGVVTIPGFYDGVSLSDDNKAMLSRVPDDERQILSDIGLVRADSLAPTLQEAIQYPSLNVRGVSAGWVGVQARTIIPPTATAELDIRLVVESEPDRLMELLQTHVESLGYTVLDRAPTADDRRRFDRIVSLDHELSYGAFRSDMDSPAGRMARAGLEALYGEEPILIRTMGGSIPIAPIIEALGVPAAIVPTVNIDNNQHSPNENLRLGNFVEGIVMLMAVLAQSPP